MVLLGLGLRASLGLGFIGLRVKVTWSKAQSCCHWVLGRCMKIMHLDPCRGEREWEGMGWELGFMSAGFEVAGSEL